MQHGEDLVLVGMDRRQQGFGDGGQRLAQVTVVVQRIDQCGTDTAITRGQVRQMQLPQQMVGQCFGFGYALGGAAGVVVIVEAAAAAGRAPVQFGRCPVVAGIGTFCGRVTVVAIVAIAAFVAGAAAVTAVGPVQQRIAFHRLGDLQLQLGGGHLQQLDRLLQLGREHQLLSQRCLQPSLHACAERKERDPALAVTA